MTSRKIKELPPPSARLTKLQFDEIETAFKKFDTDGSGLLDRHELKSAFAALGFDVKKSKIQSILDKYDPKKYGGIDKSSFHKIIDPLVLSRDPLNELKKSYANFDHKRQGRPIDLKMLRRICKEFNVLWPDAKLQLLIDEFDEDGDGVINEDDFIRVFMPRY